MKVVSVIPETFQEYENHISIVLFFFGCNFRCSYCYNYDHISNVENILEDTPKELVDKHMNPLVDGLVLLGGEPTIYGDDLLNFAEWVKNTYKLDIKLFTNGSNPEIVIEGLSRGLFDRVSIDFKYFRPNDSIDFKQTGITSRTYIHRILNLLIRLQALKLNDKIEVRTTTADCMNPGDFQVIKSICDHLDIPHILQKEVSDSYRKLGVL